MRSLAPPPALPEVTVPLMELVHPYHRHYFTGSPDDAHYRVRRYDFGPSPLYLPLVRAYLGTLSAHRDDEYRHLFTLLGSELAANALAHTRSGLPGGTYSLLAERHRDGITLTCRDEGRPTDRVFGHRDRAYLAPDPGGLDPSADAGRGLAMIDALSTRWGDNGQPSYRQVWCYLAYDFADSAWPGL
ncbi:ATP-binding protein [Nocardiopsis lucentensis]|uniref:ATP-binding protein n=1 Tax=Nocardiopsis lucentensis TaxID=53441 RepID=UPI00034B483A|nr:ATP-binding protein [Nocardiopsis lucentensis]